MPLVRCHEVHGFATVVDHEPRMDVFEDVLFVPAGLNLAAGVFDRGRRLVTAAGSFRGISYIHPIGSKFVSDVDPDLVDEVIDQEDLAFAGQLHEHYGHYVIGTLSRLWWMPLAASSDAKLLVLNTEDLEALLAYPFVHDTLAALGLGKRNFVQFDRPVRIRRLLVPEPAFQENNLAHRAFARFCNRMGRAIAGAAGAAAASQPVYVSKSKLRSGVSVLVNEDEVCEHIERRGVAVVHPEAMTLREQIRLFQGGGAVSGLAGSALHTGIFAPGNRLVIVNLTAQIWSNQLLLDGANDNTSLYLHPRDDVTQAEPDGRFSNNFRLADPRRTASELRRALDAFVDANGLPARAGGEEDPDEAATPAGKLVSRGKPASQSSTSPYSKGSAPADDAAGAVSGLLTGYFQFHTDYEDGPWWEIDLLQDDVIHEIRLYNRLDPAGERSASFRVLARTGRQDWVEVLRRENQPAFGGLDGHPFIWRPWPRLTARFVRLQLLGSSYLHLDQVMIYGEPA